VLKHAESFLNIGDEEMRPIEAEPALIGRHSSPTMILPAMPDNVPLTA